MGSEEKNSTNDFLERALKTGPGFVLPDNFAERVAGKAARRFAWNQYFREFLIYFAAIAGILGISAGMALIWFPESWNSWLNVLRSNLTLVVGIYVLALFVLFADRVLLRYFLDKVSAGEA